MKYGIFGVFLAITLFFCVPMVDPFSKDLLMRCTDGEKVPFDFPKLNEILSKPLHYLSHGHESIVFTSEDDKYVVKFFLTREIFTTPRFKPKRNLNRFFFGPVKVTRSKNTLKKYAQVFHRLPESAALLAVHEYESQDILPLCTLIDHQGITRTLNLNPLAFIVQIKAKTIKKHLSPLELESLKPKLHDLFTTLSKNGFVDLRTKFNPLNFGILDDKAVIIDTGQLDYRPNTIDSQAKDPAYYSHF